MLRITLLLSIFLLTGCATTTYEHYVYPKPCKSIRFATYNLYWQNSSRSKVDPDSITNIIRTVKPDIMVLQETFCFSETRMEKLFKREYPYRYFRHCDDRGHEDGLGILSKYPIVKNYYFPPVYGWFPGWLFVLKTPRGYLQVLNVHLNPKLISDNNVGFLFEALWVTPRFRLQEINYYHHFLNPNIPTIIAGDFNENDGGIASTYLRNHCYRDLLLENIPGYIKTWHWNYGLIKLTGRYDRIYTTQNIQSLQCQVFQKGLSDHYPVYFDY